MNLAIETVHALLDVAHTSMHLADDLPTPTATAPPGTALSGINKILGWAKWISLTVCLLGLMAAGAMMAIQNSRGEGGEHASKIMKALLGVVIISAATSAVSALSGN